MPELIPCNPPLRDTFNLLQAATAFVNPQASILTSLTSTGVAKQLLLDAAIAGLNPLDPDYAVNLTNLTNLKTKFVAIMGQSNGTDFNNSAFGKFQLWTNFMSGQPGIFPYNELSTLGADPAGMLILADASFMTVMSLAQGARVVSSELCVLDPDDPCAAVSGIFGSIVGTFNAQLQAILAMLSGMTDFIGNALSYIAQLQAFISAIEAQILAELNNLIAMIMMAINYGFAKLLKAIGINDCLASVIQAVGTNALKTALQI